MVNFKWFLLLCCISFHTGTTDTTRTDRSSSCSSSTLDVKLDHIWAAHSEKGLNLLQTGAVARLKHVDRSEVVLNKAHLSRDQARKTKKQKEANPGTLLVVTVLFLVIAAAVVVVYIVLEHRVLSRRQMTKGTLPHITSSAGPKMPWQEVRKGLEPMLSEAVSPMHDQQVFGDKPAVDHSRFGMVNADPLSYQSADQMRMAAEAEATQGHRAGEEPAGYFAPQHLDPLKWTRSTVSETFVSREVSRHSSPEKQHTPTSQPVVVQTAPVHQQTIYHDPIGNAVRSVSPFSPRPQAAHVIAADVLLPPAPLPPVTIPQQPQPHVEPVSFGPVIQQIPFGVATISPGPPTHVLSPRQQGQVVVSRVPSADADFGGITAVPHFADGGSLGSSLILSDSPEGGVVVQGFTNEFGRSFDLKAGDTIVGLNSQTVTGKAMLLQAIAAAEMQQQKMSFTVRPRVVSSPAQVMQAVAAPTPAAFVGKWGYADDAEEESSGERYQYQLSANQQGPGLVFMQQLPGPSEETVTGLLKLHSDNTFCGTLMKRSADSAPEIFGELRLRLDLGTQEMVSTLRTGTAEQWGDEVRARRVDLSL